MADKTRQRAGQLIRLEPIPDSFPRRKRMFPLGGQDNLNFRHDEHDVCISITPLNRIRYEREIQTWTTTKLADPCPLRFRPVVNISKRKLFGTRVGRAKFAVPILEITMEKKNIINAREDNLNFRFEYHSSLITGWMSRADYLRSVSYNVFVCIDGGERRGMHSRDLFRTEIRAYCATNEDTDAWIPLLMLPILSKIYIYIYTYEQIYIRSWNNVCAISNTRRDSFVELENSDFNEISILVSFFKCKNVSTV